MQFFFFCFFLKGVRRMSVFYYHFCNKISGNTCVLYTYLNECIYWYYRLVKITNRYWYIVIEYSVANLPSNELNKCDQGLIFPQASSKIYDKVRFCFPIDIFIHMYIYLYFYVYAFHILFFSLIMNFSQ